MTIRTAFTHNSKVADKEPDWGSVEKPPLPDLAFAQPPQDGKKSTRGWPHHWVSSPGGKDDNGEYTTGTLWLHRGGLRAAWSAAHGGRSGKKAPAAVIAHLRKHWNDLGVKVSELQELDPEIDVAALDRELIAAGLVAASELGYEPDLTPFTK
jgi:hypothetical protein